MKIRIWLSDRIKDKYYINGEMSKAELDEIKCFGCTTLTLGKISVVANKIVGWEVLN